MNLYHAAYEALICPIVSDKIAAANQLSADWQAGRLEAVPIPLPDVQEAGRPSKPQLVSPKHLPKRKLNQPEGQAAMLHAIAHIEFNAINLALDAVYRFQNMPADFYGDWIQVAVEEGRHFLLLQQRLQALGYDYGDFPAHDGLWQLAQQTAHDVLARMALIPRMMEARGLDVTPSIMKKFATIGDQKSLACLEIILKEEIGHVAAGSRWFFYICQQRNLEAETTYIQLLKQYIKGKIRCPLHEKARLQAGFSPQELARLKQLCQ